MVEERKKKELTQCGKKCKCDERIEIKFELCVKNEMIQKWTKHHGNLSRKERRKKEN